MGHPTGAPRRPHGRGRLFRIGARYRIDPTLVRVAFIVATLFGGSGILLRRGLADVSRHERTIQDRRPQRPIPPRQAARRGRHNLILLVMILLAIHTVSGFGSQTWGSGGLMGMILMLAGWWLLYRRTPAAPPGTGADNYHAPSRTGRHDRALLSALDSARHDRRAHPRGIRTVGRSAAPGRRPDPGFTPAAHASPAPAAAARAPWSSTEHRSRRDRRRQSRPTPDSRPGTAVLGSARAAPFAWDLPEPATPEQDSPDTGRSPWTPMVLGVAILAAAGGIAANLAGAEWFSPLRIAALALAVIGVA